jgi:hypothetical protein
VIASFDVRFAHSSRNRTSGKNSDGVRAVQPRPKSENPERDTTRLRLSRMHRLLLAALLLSSGALAAVVSSRPPAPLAASSEAKYPLTLISDGATWVSITHVLMPVKFQTKQMQLAAGEYEVVGRRKFYRDERRLIRVGSGEPQSITVICTVTMKE